ncbi:MAG: 30S ribosomal protein S1 [Ignavibacteria bacterium]|nr:30S ribosomal protein S1 [Bacteroidota bacterium]MSQ46083.1 30S ribosomal protein S1 [Ignavibacteria bacterium]
MSNKEAQVFTNTQYSEDERKQLLQLYEGSFAKLTPGDLIKGKVVRIGDSDVVLDIGFKSEGTIPKSEFANLDAIQIGEELEVYLENIEDKNGQLVLSYKRANFMRVWEKIIKAHETGEVLRGKCLRRIKGGLVVNLFGIEAFLPGSQIDVRPVRDFDIFIDKEMDFRIVKINHQYENVVISHKILVEEELTDQRQAILNTLEKGQIVAGTVKAFSDFGVFIDLGGVDGLIHITDLSWGRINHSNEILTLDQEINVVILDFDVDKKRISLGYKQLQKHPWEGIEFKYPIGFKVTGKVVSLTDYGAFIEIEKGIEGLIHVSEMSWTQHVKNPSQLVSLGQMIEAVIISLDVENKKISLGMKQLTPDPWSLILEKYPINSKHSGIVRGLTNFGVFVELEEGIDGLVHISDLSWTKKLRHPGEVIKKGQKLDVIVLNIDVTQRRITLGHKQISDNPWDVFASIYKIGSETEGIITRLIEKGVIVELPMGVEGFVPTSQLSQTPVTTLSETFHEKEKLPLTIIEFDKENKKIILSVIEYLRGKDQVLIDEYVAQHHLPPITLKDVVPYVSGEQTIDDVSETKNN